MREIVCAICKTNKNTKILYTEKINYKKISSKTFSARRSPDKMHYRLVECRKCRLIFSNPIFDEKTINSLYSKSTFNYKLESEYLKNTYWNYFNKFINPKTVKDFKILEIGCGNGFFLEKLQEMGVESVYGVEPGKPSVLKASEGLRKNIKVSILKKGVFPNGLFDVVLCFHTLDHIVDPSEFLKITNGLLKKDGKILFIVHNSKGLSVKLLGERSPIFDIEHIFLFNKNNLKSLFKLNEFKNLRTFDVKNTYPLSYWLFLFPIPLSIKKAVLTLLNVTKLGLLPISLKAGNIGIIGEK